MRLLYVVFILSTAALLWAAYAIFRAVKGQQRPKSGSTLNLRAEAHESEPESGSESGPGPGPGPGPAPGPAPELRRRP